jgi:hypothetical protein
MHLLFLFAFLFQSLEDIPTIPSAIPFDQAFEAVENIPLEASHEDSLLSDVRKVLEFEDKLLVLDLGSQPKVLIFERNGQFVGPLGRFGSGPGEYASATDIAVLDDHIYIIDGMSGSIAAFNKDFEVVWHQTFMEWTKGTIRNASRFLSLNPSSLLFAGAITPDNKSTYIADMNKDGVPKLFGEVSDLVFKYGFRDGGGLVHNSKLYWVKPLEPYLFHYDLDGKQLGQQRIVKPVWPVVTLEETEKSLAGKAPWDSKAFRDYSRKHLSPHSLTRIGDYLLLDYAASIIVFTLEGKNPTPIAFKHFTGIVSNPEGRVGYAVQEEETENPMVIFYTLKTDFVKSMKAK